MSTKPEERVSVEVKRMWRCPDNGIIYGGPRCAGGVERHLPVTVTVTTTTAVTDGHDTTETSA